MKKREQGVLSVEASIVLTLMLLFVLFLFSFGRVYRAQNLVSHAALQSADAVAVESYLRETALQADAAEIAGLANQITSSSAISAESLESLRSANLPKIARQKFIAAIAESEEKADEKLKSLGVKNGLSGVDFSQCRMDLGSDDVIIAVTYTIEMQFPVFGYDEITVTKAAKAKTFGEILFEVSTKPNNPGWGSTSGDDKVVHGSTVQITATPNYGYKFVSWDDGNTDNPRTVTITDAQSYIAIFERDSFGINIRTKIEYNQTHSVINHTNYGVAEGAGVYKYLDEARLVATPAEHYEFKGWDLNGDGQIDNTNKTITLSVDKNYDHVVAVFKPVAYKVSVSVNNASYGTATAQQGSSKGYTIRAEYGSRVTLVATVKDQVMYSFEKWSYGWTNTTDRITVTGDIHYEALFITNTYTVSFYSDNQLVHTATVIRGSSIDGSAQLNPRPSMPNLGSTSTRVLDGWSYSGKAFYSTTTVSGNISVYAAWVTPSVRITGGDKGQNATSFGIEKYPADAQVNWRVSDTSKASVNNYGYVVAKKAGTVTITATLTYKGVTVQDTVTVQVGESEYEVVYCMNMASGGIRYYTKTHITLYKTYKWGAYFPGTNHHCYTAQSYAKKTVKYSVLDNSKVVEPGTKFKGKYTGYNKSDDVGYVFYNGTGDAMYFVNRVVSGPGGYYITQITH